MLRPTALSLLLLLPIATNPATQDPTPVVSDPTVARLEFAGGTMTQLVELLRQQQPLANIVVATSAATAQLPPMMIRDAGLNQVLAAACDVADGRGPIELRDFRGEGKPIYTIQVQADAANVVDDESMVRTKVLTIAELIPRDGLPGLDAAAILSALEIATGGPRKLQTLQYHEPSDLLVVRGSEPNVVIVEEVLEVLRDRIEQQRQKILEKREEARASVRDDGRK